MARSERIPQIHGYAVCLVAVARFWWHRRWARGTEERWRMERSEPRATTASE